MAANVIMFNHPVYFLRRIVSKILTMKNVIIAAAVFTLAMSSCKKDDSAPGGGPVTEDFSPGKSGSSWTYQSATTGEYTLTMSNADTTINGRKYNIYNSTNGANEYRAKDGNNYYRFLNVGAPLNVGVEELYLKSDAGVGADWTVNQNVMIGSIPTTLKLNYTIAEKGQTKTVLGNTYNNVTKVNLEIAASSAIGNLPAGNGTFYYSPDAGIISYKLLIKNPLTQDIIVDNSFELKSYTLK